MELVSFYGGCGDMELSDVFLLLRGIPDGTKLAQICGQECSQADRNGREWGRDTTAAEKGARSHEGTYTP